MDILVRNNVDQKQKEELQSECIRHDYAIIKLKA